MATESISKLRIPDLPSREFRLLFDGIQEWVDRISGSARSYPYLGILEGPPGQGTAALMDALRVMCPGLGIEVLGGGFAREGTIPAGPFGEVVEQVLPEAVTEGRSRNALTEHGPELRRLFPELGWPADLESLPELGPRRDRMRLVDSLVRWLLDVARSRPMLLLLEDLQRADGLSLEIVNHLLRMLLRDDERRGRPHRLLVVVSARGDSAVLRSLETSPRRTAFRIQVRGYSREEIRELAQRRLGRDLPLSSRENIYRATGGNVRLVHWMLDAPSVDEAVSGPQVKSFEILVTEAYRRLDRSEQDILLRLAATGTAVTAPFLLDWLGEGVEARLEEGDPLSTLEESLRALEASGWVHSLTASDTPAARKFFLQPEIGALVLAGADGAMVEDLWRQAACRLLDFYGAQGRVLVQAAGLFLLADGGRAARRGRATPEGSPDDHRERFLRTAFAATAFLEHVGCHEEALDLAEGLVKAGSSLEEVEELRALVARLLEETGNFREAIEIHEARLERLDGGAADAALWRRIGDLRGRLDERHEQLQCYRKALDVVGDGDNGERRLTLTAMARMRLETDDLEEALGLCREALGLEADDDLERAAERESPDVVGIAARVHEKRMEFAKAARLEQKLLESYEAAGDFAGAVNGLFRLVRLHAAGGDRSRARGCLERALAMATRSRSRFLVARALHEFGVLASDDRNVGEAARHLREAREVYADLGCDDEILQVEGRYWEVELRQGRCRAAASTLCRVVESRHDCAHGWPLREGEETGDRQLVSPARSRPRPLRSRKIAALERRARRSSAAFEPTEVLELAEHLAASGKVKAALAVLRRAAERDGDATSPAGKASRLRFEGRLHRLMGNAAMALRSFEGSLQCLSGSSEQSTVAGAYLEVGSVLMRMGHVARAFDYTVRGVRLLLDGDGEPESLLPGLLCLGEFFVESGQLHAAALVSSTATSLARACGHEESEIVGCRLTARAASEAGGRRAARLAFERARELEGRVDSVVEMCALRLEYGWDRQRLGKHEEAMDLAREGVELARASNLLALLDDLLHLYGVIEGSPSNPGKNFLHALEVLERALHGAEKRRRPLLRHQVLTAMSRVYASRGKEQIAADYAARAERTCEQLSSSLPRNLALLRWGCRLKPQNPA